MRRFAEEIGVAASVDFAGSVSPAELTAYYLAADVLVCCSEHEGFCAPLLEAMHYGVPVVAYGIAAVPETVLGAGGHERARTFTLEAARSAFAAAVGQAIEAGP